jgi:hypothetical protein
MDKNSDAIFVHAIFVYGTIIKNMKISILFSNIKNIIHFSLTDAILLCLILPCSVIFYHVQFCSVFTVLQIKRTLYKCCWYLLLEYILKNLKVKNLCRKKNIVLLPEKLYADMTHNINHILSTPNPNTTASTPHHHYTASSPPTTTGHHDTDTHRDDHSNTTTTSPHHLHNVRHHHHHKQRWQRGAIEENNTKFVTEDA